MKISPDNQYTAAEQSQVIGWTRVNNSYGAVANAVSKPVLIIRFV